MEDDEDQGCCVCYEDEDGILVYCDGEGCNVATHPDCYGYPLIKRIPDEEWFCDACRAMRSGYEQPHCALCPGTDGAMKRTTDGKWCHIVCALWVPEAFFRFPEGREPIDLLHIPKDRFDLICSLCGNKEGACVECSHVGCEEVFHVSCAMSNGLLFDYHANTGTKPDVVWTLCPTHTLKYRNKNGSS